MSAFLRLVVPTLAVVAAALSGSAAPVHAAGSYAAANKTRYFVLKLKGTQMQKYHEFANSMYFTESIAGDLMEAFALDDYTYINRTSDVLSWDSNDTNTRELTIRFSLAPRANVSDYVYATQAEADAMAGGHNASYFLSGNTDTQPGWFRFIPVYHWAAIEEVLSRGAAAAAAYPTLPPGVSSGLFVSGAALDPRDPAYKGAASSVIGGFVAAAVSAACVIGALAL